MNLVDYGIAGGVIVSLFALIYFIIKGQRDERSRHSDERKEWRQSSERQFDIIANAKERDAVILNDIKNLLRERR